MANDARLTCGCPFGAPGHSGGCPVTVADPGAELRAERDRLAAQVADIYKRLSEADLTNWQDTYARVMTVTTVIRNEFPELAEAGGHNGEWRIEREGEFVCGRDGRPLAFAGGCWRHVDDWSELCHMAIPIRP